MEDNKAPETVTPESPETTNPNGAGRPTLFKEEYCDQVYRLCLLGLVDSEIAEFFDVTETTINNWKTAHPQFFESIRAGKTIADGNVAKGLYDRAVGCKVHGEQAFKVKRVKYGDNGRKIEEYEEVVTVPICMEEPPDTKAIVYFLNNRSRKRKEKWMDRIDHTSDGEAMPLEFTLNMGGSENVRGADD